MPDLNGVGRVLLLLGIGIALIGGLLMLGARIPWLGRLPGDIAVERENFRFYFPIMTSVVISVVLSLLFWLFRR